MAYRQQMDKALREYFGSHGFKYSSKYMYYRKLVNDDMYASIGIGFANYGCKEFYSLTILCDIEYISWCNLFKELYELPPLRTRPTIVQFQTTSDRIKEKRVTFTSERTMEENIAELHRNLEKYAYPIIEKYKDKSVLYKDMFELENKSIFPDFIAYPVACFMNKDYDKALEYAKYFRDYYEEKATKYPNGIGFKDRQRGCKCVYDKLFERINSLPEYKKQKEGLLSKISKLFAFSLMLLLSTVEQ